MVWDGEPVLVVLESELGLVLGPELGLELAPVLEPAAPVLEPAVPELAWRWRWGWIGRVVEWVRVADIPCFV